MTHFNRPTLVTLTAPTCSGKSHLLNALTDSGLFSRIVSTTTRAPRPGEKQGVDYDFISLERSLEMEARGEFFELVEFNGTRYGVTHAEMEGAMGRRRAPIVILEPQGLEIYRRKCIEKGWGIFRMYVHVQETLQLQRLIQRTIGSMWDTVDGLAVSGSRNSQAFQEVGMERAKKQLSAALNEHHRRTFSIIQDERTWLTRFSWDAIIPGDDVDKATEMIRYGIAWRNKQEEPPRAIGAVTLPL
jgi:guanylate kinase